MLLQTGFHTYARVYFNNIDESKVSINRSTGSAAATGSTDFNSGTSGSGTTTQDTSGSGSDSSGYDGYSYSSGSGYSSGGYSSGGYSSSGYDYEAAEEKAKEEAKELAEKAASNLSGVVGYNAETLRNAATQSDKNYDVAEEQNLNLKNLENRQARRNAGNSWYTEQQNLQSALQELLNSAGNAANGSFLKSVWDIMARADDMADAETLNTLRENLNTQDNEYWEAIMQINNSRNDMYAETEQNLRDLASDYAAQLNNLETIDTDLLGDMINTEDHTLNVPDWLNTAYYDEHARSAIVPDEVSLVRDANAAQAANKLTNLSTANLAQNANSDYWTRLRNSYSRRTQ